MRPEKLADTAAAFLRLHRGMMACDASLGAASRLNVPVQLRGRVVRQRLSFQLALLRYRVHGRKLFLDAFIVVSLLVFAFFTYQLYRAWWIHNRRQEKFEALVAAPIKEAVNSLELEARRKKGITDEDGDAIF